MNLGVLVGPVGDVATTLQDRDALGPRAVSPGFGYSVGGGGRALMLRRLMVGGRGFGVFSSRVGGDRGFATVGGGGGGLELGIAALNRDAWLLIPYVGGGAGGVTLDVSNDSDAPLAIGDDEPIPAGGQRSYEAGFGYVEFGLAAHRLLFFDSGGFALGVDIGGLVSVSPSKWSTSSREVEGIDSARLSGGFVRFSIAGGGFSFD